MPNPTISAQDARRELAIRVATSLDISTRHEVGRAKLWLSDAEMAVVLDALRAEPARGAEEMRALTDPVAVHVNMLRGTIAKPSVENIIHLYGADVLRRALPLPQAKGGGESTTPENLS